jgi:DNA-binding FrmR family transcriptional regulator
VQVIADEVKTDLRTRLRRIEGQMRGVQKMLDENRDCQEVLQQLAAARAAFQNASLIFARNYALQCLHDPQAKLTDEEMVEQLVSVLSKA